MSELRTVRCLMIGCTNTVTTSGYRPKRCPTCLRKKWRAEAAAKYLKRTGRVMVPREAPVESYLQIEARYQAALKVIKSTPREVLLGWSSPLAGLK